MKAEPVDTAVPLLRAFPAYHPPPEVLLDYATGTLNAATALIVATHLALCPNCRQYVQVLEAVGGAMLAESEPMAVSAACLEAVLASLDRPETPEMPETLKAASRQEEATGFPIDVPDFNAGFRTGIATAGIPEVARRAAGEEDCLLPRPLRGYLGTGGEGESGWELLAPGVERWRLVCPGLGEDARVRPWLLRLSAGHSLPLETLRHASDAVAVMIVLTGRCMCASEPYGRGDILIHRRRQPPLRAGDAGDALLLWAETTGAWHVKRTAGEKPKPDILPDVPKDVP